MTMDQTDIYLGRVLNERTAPLERRFNGIYVAEVVETNDPLNMHRVKFRCPELHDWNIKPEEAPWATVAFYLGGKRAGFWTHPCIGDLITIEFEKGHPYSPICTGFANPTRRKMYTYPSLYTESPVPVNEDGKKINRPEDYDIAYLPSDRRPMSTGINDRYGNLDIISSVGYFPKEHDITPPPPGHDAISGKAFSSKNIKPLVNSPDKKYMARVSKYGMAFIQSDQGYFWKSKDDFGEFTGDFADDETFETKRWLYYQRLLNEDDTTRDSRRISLLTRYGHLFEMRDTGWAQKGPLDSKSRDEYGTNSAYLSEESSNDMRWIKMRTKGGMLIQLIDVGSDPQNDNYIKRKLLDEVYDKVEKENSDWKDRDARQMRFVSRHGYKIVLDDRGSSKTAAENGGDTGNGILIKGRRNNKGFYWEFNENDKANHTSWGTPNGRSIELNDRYGYAMIATGLNNWATEWQGLKDNEFIRKPLMLNRNEFTTYHLTLNDIDKYIRLKSADNSNQGLEIRDDDPWVELVAKENRGLWISDRYKLLVLRGSDSNDSYIWLDEVNGNVTMYNGSGDIRLFANTKIQIESNSDINLQAKGSISLNASEAIKFKGGACTLALRGNQATFSDEILGNVIKADLVPGAAGQLEPVDAIQQLVTPAAVAPDKRGSSQSFEECPIDDVRHPYTT